jgi:hypothetical protein
MVLALGPGFALGLDARGVATAGWTASSRAATVSTGTAALSAVAGASATAAGTGWSFGGSERPGCNLIGVPWRLHENHFDTGCGGGDAKADAPTSG